MNISFVKIIKLLIQKAYMIFAHLLYGLSLLLPYTSDRPNYLAIPSFSICLAVLAIFLSITQSIEISIWVSLVFMIGYLGISIFNFSRITDYVDRLRAEKYYRIKIPSNKADDSLYFVEAIRLHRKYGKFDEYDKFDRQAGRLKYIEDQSLIKEYRRFNRKWEMIAIIYILLHVLAIYFWNEY